MKMTKRLGSMILALVLATGLMMTTSKADDWDQATKFTFAQPIEIPGQTLPAGTYWFKLIGGTNSDRDTIMIYNADRTQFVTSVPTIPTSKVDSIYGMPYETQVTLAEGSDGRPAALMTWFYPDNPQGHEFYYSTMEKHRLSEQQHITAKADAESTHGVLSASLQ